MSSRVPEGKRRGAPFPSPSGSAAAKRARHVAPSPPVPSPSPAWSSSRRGVKRRGPPLPAHNGAAEAKRPYLMLGGAWPPPPPAEEAMISEDVFPGGTNLADDEAALLLLHRDEALESRVSRWMRPALTADLAAGCSGAVVHSICGQMKGFEPGFYISCPLGMGPDNISWFHQSLEGRTESDQSSNGRRFVKSVDLAHKQTTHYQPHQPLHFLKTTVSLPTMISICCGILESGITIEYLGLKSFLTYEGSFLGEYKEDAHHSVISDLQNVKARKAYCLKVPSKLLSKAKQKRLIVLNNGQESGTFEVFTVSPESAYKLKLLHSIFKRTSGEIFVILDLQKGELPENCEERLAARKGGKMDLKEVHAFELGVLDGRRLDLNATANSVCGFTESSVDQLPCLNVSPCVNSHANLIEEEHSRLRYDHNPEVVSESAQTPLGSGDSYGDESSSTMMNTQVFVMHPLQTLSLQIDTSRDLNHLKAVVEKRSQMKISEYFFVHGLNVLEAHKPLSSYGITRESHIYMCHRLRGGRKFETLLTFVEKHEAEFLRTVEMPDGSTGTELTEMGYLILLTLIHCFTSTFASQRSWNGLFDLESFKVVRGRVRILIKPREQLTALTMHHDCTRLIQFIRVVFILNGKYPPYLDHLLMKLGSLSVDVLSPNQKLALDYHVSLSPYLCRISLVYHIKRKYDGWSCTEQQRFRDLLNRCNLTLGWLEALKEVVVFRDVFAGAQAKGFKYTPSGHHAFLLTRNYNTHAPEYSWVTMPYDGQQRHDYQWFQCNSGLELMLPKYMGDFVAEVVYRLIEENFDIKDIVMASTVCTSCIGDTSSESSSSGSSDKRKRQQDLRGNASSDSSSSGSSKKRKRRQDLSSKKSQLKRKKFGL